MIYERQWHPHLSIKKLSKEWGVSLQGKSLHRMEYRAPSEWDETITERLKWLRDNAKGDVYITNNCNTYRKVYCFRLKEDAMLFKLVWG